MIIAISTEGTLSTENRPVIGSPIADAIKVMNQSDTDIILYVDNKQVGEISEWNNIYQYIRKLEDNHKKNNAMLGLFKFANLIGVTKQELLGNSRKQELSDARQVYYHKLYTSGYTYREIANMFNRKVHSSIMSAKKRIDSLLEVRDSEIVRLYSLFENYMTN